jgi:hypothetical protein
MYDKNLKLSEFSDPSRALELSAWRNPVTIQAAVTLSHASYLVGLGGKLFSSIFVPIVVNIIIGRSL